MVLGFFDILVCHSSAERGPCPTKSAGFIRRQHHIISAVGASVTASETKICDDDTDYAATGWARVHFELGSFVPFTHKESSNRKCLDLMAGLCHDGDIPKKQPITVKVLGPKGKWITSTGKTVADATAKAIQKKARAASKS
jgi:hypothetical protein